MAKYTKIPTDTFEKIQMNAGIIVDDFNPQTGVASGLRYATTGGINFTDVPSFTDFGEDIDNAPKNTLELKEIESREVTVATTLVTIDPTTARELIGAADIDPLDQTHIIPRDDLKASDFHDKWILGDYSDVNTGEDAGYIAIHMMNVLSTGGFALQTADKGKGQLAATLMAHYSMKAQDTVPYEIYIKQGNEEVQPSIYLNKHTLTVAKDATATLDVTTVPASATVTWDSDTEGVATVEDGVITGVAAGNAIIEASITIEGVTYNDTCTVIVTAE